MNSTGSMRTLSVGLLSILLLASAASAAPSDADRCVAAKLNASGKRFASIAKCRAKAVLTGTPVDADCLAKAEQKFFDAFTKAEASGACAVTGDATTATRATATDARRPASARPVSPARPAPTPRCARPSAATA